VFYNDLKLFVEKAKSNKEIEVLSFDFQQNMPLPHIPCGDVFYKRQIWVYNLYDEWIAKKEKTMLLVSFTIFLKINSCQV